MSFLFFLQAHVSIQDLSYPLPRVHGYFQPFSLEYPQVVEVEPPDSNMGTIENVYCYILDKSHNFDFKKKNLIPQHYILY